jgi:hypothetical protein
MTKLQNYCTALFLFVKFQDVKFFSTNFYDFLRFDSSKKSSLLHKKSQIDLEMLDAQGLIHRFLSPSIGENAV